MSKNKALNISDVLLKLDRNDYGFYDSLSDAEIKEISPWVLMRFMSSCESNPEIYLISVNENVNVYFAMLPKHKKLQCMLLANCGIGSRQSHKWVAPPKAGKKANNELFDVLKSLLPDKNTKEIEIIIKLHNNSELIEYLTICGVDEKQIKAIFDE